MNPTISYERARDLLTVDCGRRGIARFQKQLTRLRIESTDVYGLRDWLFENADWVRAKYRRLALAKR